MSSIAVAERLTSYYSSGNYSQSNCQETSASVSPPYSILIPILLGVATAFVVQSYHSKDVHITPGQVTATMDADGESVLMKSMWSSPLSAWVERMVGLCKCGNEDAALKEISLTTTDFKSSGNFLQLATDLASVDFAWLPDIVLIGLLRNTYSVRAHISNWDTLLDQTEKILMAHNKNSRALLRGLRG